MDAKTAELFQRVMSMSAKPSRVILQILEYQDEHARYMLNNYNGFIEYYEHSFDCIIGINFMLNYLDKAHFPRQRAVQLLIYTDNIGTLYSAFDRLKGGFYSDCMILCRSAFESIIRMMFCSYYPDEADAVWVDDLPKGRVKFNVTRFLRDQLKVDWTWLYRLLCLHSHSNIMNSLQRYGKLVREEQKEPIAFQLSIEVDKTQMCMNVLTFLLWNFVYFYKLFFLKEDGPRLSANLMANLEATEELLSTTLESSPNALKQTCQDAIDIYARLLEMERQAREAS
jgi:hypothetical protein